MANHSPGFIKLVDEARAHVRECTVHDLRARLADAGDALPFVLIDVREESEWQKDHIKGAIHLGKGVIERDIEARVPDAATPLVLYCGGGFRSALAGKNLRAMGYTDVTSVDGGIRGWREAGYPLVTD
jgi:rhodanese-related sulfurtransferase